VLRHLFVVFALLFALSLFATPLPLKSHYSIEKPCIPLALFTKTDRNICLLHLSKHRLRWQIPAYRLQKLLEKEGIATRSPDKALITFELRPTKRFERLAHALTCRYRSRYPTLQIDHITIVPTNHESQNLHDEANCSLRLSNAQLRRNRGNFLVACGLKRYFFRYLLKGAIPVYKARHQIKKDTIIDSENVAKISVSFERFNDRPITDRLVGRYVARQNIGEGKIVTERMVRPIPDVRKNERIRCFYHDGAVTIEFDANALQSGYIGDTIVVQKSGGKTMKGVITQKGMVEIR